MSSSEINHVSAIVSEGTRILGWVSYPGERLSFLFLESDVTVAMHTVFISLSFYLAFIVACRPVVPPLSRSLIIIIIVCAFLVIFLPLIIGFLFANFPHVNPFRLSLLVQSLFPSLNFAAAAVFHILSCIKMVKRMDKKGQLYQYYYNIYRDEDGTLQKHFFMRKKKNPEVKSKKEYEIILDSSYRQPLVKDFAASSKLYLGDLSQSSRIQGGKSFSPHGILEKDVTTDGPGSRFEFARKEDLQLSSNDSRAISSMNSLVSTHPSDIDGSQSKHIETIETDDQLKGKKCGCCHRKPPNNSSQISKFSNSSSLSLKDRIEPRIFIKLGFFLDLIGCVVLMVQLLICAIEEKNYSILLYNYAKYFNVGASLIFGFGTVSLDKRLYPKSETKPSDLMSISPGSS
ncbi:hypothetical protein ADUPG1_009576 [Aduncisulcus paluster]|uniref:Uncharacterized protein n=1 Tax=Aduncisulcus paluster TaxID=2918883 RepID=A0ABQ5KXA8_9EUKA|nr:hypothetical protein ADUPG1_009576 [Aduncisulcus paluster]